MTEIYALAIIKKTHCRFIIPLQRIRLYCATAVAHEIHEKARKASVGYFTCSAGSKLIPNRSKKLKYFPDIHFSVMALSKS
jgi:hypothetical protein